MQELDRVFDSDDVLGPGRVDAIEHRRERSGLTGTGDAGDEHHAASFLADLFDDLWHVELFERLDLGGDDAEDESDVAALLEDVHTEASQAGYAVCHVELGGLFELLLLPVAHHA